MTSQPPENTQFFLTAETPCPYLPGRRERKLFAHMSGRRAQIMHAVLSDHGFRRSQNIVYRPACEGCSACQSVRIAVRDFAPNRRLRRIEKHNADIVSQALPARVTSEQYGLFSRYLSARHPGGGMTEMTPQDYEFMVEDTPVETVLVEYRLNSGERPLVGVALTDILPDGLSMVYSFFDPALGSRSLGNYMILNHIARARDFGFGYVYLGYWVKDSQKMAYKAEFAPLEVQTGSLGWQPLDPKA